MKFTLFFVLVSAVSVIEGKTFLTQTETKILLRIAYHAITKNFILVPDTDIDVTTMNLVKILWRKRIQTISIKKKNVQRFLENTYNVPIPRAAIGIKENNLENRDYFDNDTVLCNYLWVYFDGSNGTLRHQLDKIYIPYDCLLIFIEKIGNDTYYLTEYYRITKSSPGIFLEFAFWENNFLRLVGPPWYDRRSNMYGYKFVTVKFNEKHLTLRDRVLEKVWRELSYTLNFRVVYKMIDFPSLEKPFELRPGEEALLDSEIYIGVPQKSYYLLGPISQSKLFMHVRVSSESKGIQRFIRPFNSESWFKIFRWILYCSFLNFLVGFLFQRFTKCKDPQNEYLFSFFLPFYSLCVQSGGEGKNTYSSRLTLFSTRMSGAILYYAYVATFRSFLILYLPNLPFTDLKGFLENGEYKIEGERHSDLDIFFSTSPNAIEREVYEKYMAAAKWSRLDKSMERMCKGEKLVLLGFEDDILNHAPCEILRIKNPISTLVNGLKIRFKSPFRGILHTKLLQLRSAGILKRIHRRTLYANPKNFDDENNLELKMEKVVSLFIIPIVGCVASLLILAVELLLWKIKGKKSGTRKIRPRKSLYSRYRSFGNEELVKRQRCHYMLRVEDESPIQCWEKDRTYYYQEHSVWQKWFS